MREIRSFGAGFFSRTPLDTITLQVGQPKRFRMDSQMIPTTNLPLVLPKETLEALERLYPDRGPNITDSEREIWFKAGQASVARKLRMEYEAAAAKAMETT